MEKKLVKFLKMILYVYFLVKIVKNNEMQGKEKH